jgi:murein DD-endopeptidase MepM/ murein hydrolase activator NlpD
MRIDFDHIQSSIPRTRVAMLFAALLLLLSAALARDELASGQDLQSQLEGKQQKLGEVRERKGVLTTTISRYSAEIDQLEGEVATLRNREAAVEAELEEAKQELHAEKERLIELRAHLRRAMIVLKERLVAIYKAGTPDVLTVLLQSDGWSDLLERTEYLNRIQDQDNAVIDRVRDLRDQTRATVDRLRVVKKRIEAKERELERTRLSLQARQADLVAARDARQGALDRVAAQESELEGDVSDISAEIAAQLAATSSAPLPAGPVQGSSSGLIWPVSGPVVSGFGMRWGSMHEGIDIAVPAGTPIVAAASGSVVIAGWVGGYGNYTCIDHGGGLSTCYAHQSSFAASVGAGVSQGDIIGYVGCTGHCYGDHLHFEVRINGAATDPLGYL